MSIFPYRMNHCRAVLQQVYKQYNENGKPVFIKEKLLALETAINEGDKPLARSLTKELEGYSKTHFKKSWFKWAVELISALAFALIVATIIRQAWFELYEIPTGSMRPTFKEQDHLTVSKTQFGINVPLETAHFYFDPNLVQRTGAIIFSGDGIALPDTDSTFFGIFPYKKRYVKRMIGKPEDALYFYGGKLFGIDQSGKQIVDFDQKGVGMERLDHIPFISFDGNVKKTGPDSYTFSYFNIPLAKATVSPFGIWKGEIYNGSEWIQDDVKKANTPHEKISTLSDFFGMGNFGMGQLYTQEELKLQGIKASDSGILYLVIRHTPHLDFSKNKERVLRLPLVMTTVLPLNQEDLKTLRDSMYTARFVVKGGKVKRYSLESRPLNAKSPDLLGVADGTYEFYYGKAYEVLFGGITKELPESHPLYKLNEKQIQSLYNLGTNWDNQYQPKNKDGAWPSRYVYFRDGNLYTMGSPLLKKNDPRLITFNENEKKKETEQDSYVAFTDKGIPPEDNLAFYKTFGIKVPKKEYLVLGDNHAMSGDSRFFGFVPEANLQGVPDVILWPIGDRLGAPSQKPYPTFVEPRLIVWVLALLIGSAAYVIHRRKLRKPLKF